VKEIVICSAGQTGKTEAILNCLRFAIASNPGPMLWILPSESLARSFSETRLQPSLRDCPPCADQIPADEDAFKLLEMHFRDCTLNLCGANSPGQLSSRPVRFLFADEIDKFPEASGREAGALELARVRTTSFWNSKTVLTSTPSIEGGQIWQAYLAGTRSRFFVKCPVCLHAQELVFPQLKWPRNEETKPEGPEGPWNVEAVERLAYYECAACRNHIAQSWRHTMLRGGEWRPLNPQAPADKVSFHLNALYSPWRTWGSIGREFLEVKDSVSGLQNFTNSVLSEPWRIMQGEDVQPGALFKARSDYTLGTCPARPTFVFVTADVQRDCVYFVTRAWGLKEESWLLDYGRLPTMGDLQEVCRRTYPIAGTTETVGPCRGLIDSGYASQQVYELCAESGDFFRPAKGWDNLNQPVKESAIQFLPGQSRHEQRLLLFHFDDGAFKHELYIRRLQDGQGPPWHIPKNAGMDYIAQLCRERLVERKNVRGAPEQVWHRVHRDNHYADCEKLQLVMAFVGGQALREQPSKGVGKPS